MKKKQIKALKKLSEMLPESVTIEIEGTKNIKQGWELTQKEVDSLGSKFMVDGKYIQTLKKPKIVPLNHLNRLKTAFAINKEQGLADYILWLDANNKRMNALFEKMNTPEIEDEILEIAKAGGKGFWSSIMQFLFVFAQIFLNKKESLKSA